MAPILGRSGFRSTACGLLCAAALWGCAARGEMDALEADLRTKEQAQEELKSQLVRAEEDLKVARSDAATLRKQLSKQHHHVALSEEQADVVYRAEAIKFSNLLTSGQNRDGQPGDEGLSVMLNPVDVHGDLVKLAGEVELELFDMSLSADQQRLGQWKFSTAEVREHWHKGLIGSGYLFQVDWQRIPVASELTLHARFSINDGRKFDATTQVKVDPPLPQAPPVAAAGDVDRRAAAAKKKRAATGSQRDVVPASTSVISRRPVELDDVLPGAEMPPVRNPRPEAPRRDLQEQDDDSPRTSDRWTDETIPTLR
jgi:hypothetical protein